jgi:hypothetical protein
MLERAVTRLREYVEALKETKKALGPWYDDYLRVIAPNFEVAEKILGEVGDLALQANNAATLGQINDAWRMLVNLKSALDRFRQRGSAEHAAALDRLLEEAQPVNDRFRAALVTEAGKRAFAEYQEKYEAIVRAYRQHRAGVMRAEDVLARAQGWNAGLEKILHAISSEADADQKTRQAEIIESNNSTELLVLVASAAGLLIGLIFTVLILAALTSVLNKLSRFARAIADGDFEYAADIMEKGKSARWRKPCGASPQP